MIQPITKKKNATLKIFNQKLIVLDQFCLIEQESNSLFIFDRYFES